MGKPWVFPWENDDLSQQNGGKQQEHGDKSGERNDDIGMQLIYGSEVG